MRRITSLKNSSSLLLLVWNLLVSLSNPIYNIAVYPTLPFCHHYILMCLINTTVHSSPAPVPTFSYCWFAPAFDIRLGWSLIPFFRNLLCRSYTIWDKSGLFIKTTWEIVLALHLKNLGLVWQTFTKYFLLFKHYRILFRP